MDVLARVPVDLNLHLVNGAVITAQFGDAFVSSYINFFVANGAVFMPKFGDTDADANAQQIMRDHFPNRDVVALNIDNIASGGGGIDCSTHDQPGTPAQS
ncbi:agmatine deiminase family protein [Streptacidiphilus sp. MAP5-3]|uniref:agmatine deiminase family protein n=1 Tax=unclassified Streptacidiphilus TaxID=2643834 RepID=UPI003518259A